MVQQRTDALLEHVSARQCRQIHLGQCVLRLDPARDLGIVLGEIFEPPKGIGNGLAEKRVDHITALGVRVDDIIHGFLPGSLRDLGRSHAHEDWRSLSAYVSPNGLG